MSRRGSNSHYYSYHSPGGHGSSGEEGFRSPRPQYQSSPRPYGHGHGGHKGYMGPQNHGNYHYHSNMSPIAHHASPGGGEMNLNRSYSKGSPSHNPSPNYHGNRGRGRGRFHSGGHSPFGRQDSNPGGSDNIRDYFHPSMLEDPWEKLEPVPVSQPTAKT